MDSQVLSCGTDCFSLELWNGVIIDKRNFGFFFTGVTNTSDGSERELTLILTSYRTSREEIYLNFKYLKGAYTELFEDNETKLIATYDVQRRNLDSKLSAPYKKQNDQALIFEISLQLWGERGHVIVIWDTHLHASPVKRLPGLFGGLHQLLNTWIRRLSGLSYWRNHYKCGQLSCLALSETHGLSSLQVKTWLKALVWDILFHSRHLNLSLSKTDNRSIDKYLQGDLQLIVSRLFHVSSCSIIINSLDNLTMII